MLRVCSLVGLAILSAACGNDAPPGLEPTGWVRFVNLITDGTKLPVDAFLDGDPFGSSLPFGASSPLWLPPPFTAIYVALSAGEHGLVLKRSTDHSVVAGLYTLDVAAGEDRTFYATGGGGLILEETLDDNTPPQPGTLRLRVVNLSLSAGPVDIFVTAQDADLAATTPVATNVGFRQTSPYFTMAPGAYRVRAVRAGVAATARGDANLLANVNEQSWERGGRTILLSDQTNVTGVVFSVGVILSDQ